MDTFAFTEAPSTVIPTETDIVQTSGYTPTALGRGAALYVADASVDAAYVQANPRTSFISAASPDGTIQGRGFRLLIDQTITPFMFGVVGVATLDYGAPNYNGVPDDTIALQAFFDFCASHRLPSVNWGGVFGVTSGVIIGNTVDLTQFQFLNSDVFQGSIVLAVKTNIDGAVLRVHSRRQCTYGPISVVGYGLSRSWNERLFDIGMMVEDLAQMQVFSSVMCQGARLVGFYNSGRGSHADNVFQNKVETAYFSLCGSGSGDDLKDARTFFSTTTGGRRDFGVGSDPGQYTSMNVAVQPPTVWSTYNVPIFLRFRGHAQIYQVMKLEPSNSAVEVYPWVDRNVDEAATVDYICGGGLLTIDGDAGMMDAKVASTACGFGIMNLATYGGEFQLTAQYCYGDFLHGKAPADTHIGATLNLYAEGENYSIVWNANAISSLRVINNQGLKLAEVWVPNPRDGGNNLKQHIKRAGLAIFNGAFDLSIEHSEDVDGGLYATTLSFSEPYSRLVPLYGNAPSITLVNPPDLEGNNVAAATKRLFGYRARKVEIVGTGANKQPTGTLTIIPYAGLKINGGTMGATATFSGFTGPVLLRLELDPADTTNCIVSFEAGHVARGAGQADAAATTDYVAPAAGAITVTSAAAGDFTATATALARLQDEVEVLRGQHNALLAKLRASGALAS